MTSIEILLSALAGLGLFFFGIKLVARNLSAMAGDTLRRNLRRATASRPGSMLIGVLAGFVTQSGRTTSFILASFAQAGVIEVKHALPVVLWSNLGCTLIIFAAVLPIHLVALTMLGIAGGCIAFERPRPLVGAAHAVFGLALVLFGLKMMSAASPMLTHLDGFGTALGYMERSPFYAFLAGLVLTIIAQSHMSIVLLSIPLAAHGVLSFELTIMLVGGAQAGSSVVTYITGLNFRGEPRQVVVGQILYGATAVTLLLMAMGLSRLSSANGDWMQNLVSGHAASVGTQVALIALLLNAVTPLLLEMMGSTFVRACRALVSVRGEDELAKPCFLLEQIRDNATTTLLLAEQEQLRLLRRLPDYFAYLRQDSRPRTGVSPAAHHAAFVILAGHIRRCQSQLMARSLTTIDTEWLSNQQQRQDLLGSIEETCHELCEFGLAPHREDLQPIVSALAEATDAFLLTSIAAMAEADLVELDVLDRMTADRGAAMENLRKRYLSSSDALPPDARIQLLSVTSLFERAAWSLGRFGRLLRASPIMMKAPEPVLMAIDAEEQKLAS